eukprot:12210087-Alexandrium_andersonii.AAC.1
MCFLSLGGSATRLHRREGGTAGRGRLRVLRAAYALTNNVFAQVHGARAAPLPAVLDRAMIAAAFAR